MTPVDGTGTVPKDAVDLIALCVEASSAQLAYTTNALIDGLTARAEIAERTLDAVRFGITDLLHGRWQPSNAALLAALWPNVDDVEREGPA